MQERLTIKETADYLGISEKTVYRYITEDKLKVKERTGRRCYLSAGSVKDMREHLSRKKRRGSGRNGRDPFATGRMEIRPGMTAEEYLSIAIIKQAIRDYLSWSPDRRKEIETFIRPQWFGVLSLGAVDPEQMIGQLRDYAEELGR